MAAKPEPKPAKVENINQETGEIVEPVQVKKGEPITAEQWEAFGQLVQRATDAGVKLPDYKRAEMTPAQVFGATKYIEGKLK